MENMKNGLIIDANGTKHYYMNDELHREDGPAIELRLGGKLWYLHGKKHRVDGPAIELRRGGKFWYLHGERHRVDGPAEEYSDGEKAWFLNGKRHRVAGPAVEYYDGQKFWWLNGIMLVHPEEFKNMEAWFEKLNTDEEYSLPWINDINGLIEVIKNPTDKQKRLNAMKWKL